MVRSAAAAAGAHASAEVVLYEHDNHGGRTCSAYFQQADLARQGFNDKASSIIIRSGRWVTLLGNGKQVKLADQAMAAYRREQGM
jgi:hypothetical protein